MPTHRFLTEDESVTAANEFRSRHPMRLRFLAFVFGWGDLRTDEDVRAFVRARPFVSFRFGLHKERQAAPCESIPTR